MRFSLARLSRRLGGWGALLALGACASHHKNSPSPATANLPTPLPGVRPAAAVPVKPALPENLPELEKLEAQQPANPEIKQKLARAYWCQGRQGLAVENWLWIQQNHTHSSHADRAENYLKKAREKPESLRSALSCEP